MIILNSCEAAHELLEQRGAMYSDRPRFVLLSEMYGNNLRLGQSRSLSLSGWDGKMRRRTSDSMSLS